jgi:hypothetical protein
MVTLWFMFSSTERSEFRRLREKQAKCTLGEQSVGPSNPSAEAWVASFDKVDRTMVLGSVDRGSGGVTDASCPCERDEGSTPTAIRSDAGTGPQAGQNKSAVCVSCWGASVPMNTRGMGDLIHLNTRVTYCAGRDSRPCPQSRRFFRAKRQVQAFNVCPCASAIPLPGIWHAPVACVSERTRR